MIRPDGVKVEEVKTEKNGVLWFEDRYSYPIPRKVRRYWKKAKGYGLPIGEKKWTA